MKSKMEHISGCFTFRRCGTCGCELLDPGGIVDVWTVNVAWAAVIVELLNDGTGQRCQDWHADVRGPVSVAEDTAEDDL